jgi:hypothetical protein
MGTEKSPERVEKLLQVISGLGFERQKAKPEIFQIHSPTSSASRCIAGGGMVQVI